MSFFERLQSRCRSISSHLCVGIDPRLAWMPDELSSGDGPDERALALERFGFEILDLVSDQAACVKPQSAFFEREGWRGVRALERICAEARRRGLLVIGDVKRGDIGSTAQAYAEAAFGRDGSEDILFDAVTVNPYMGRDAVLPFYELGQRRGCGVFVLMRTSNPGAEDLQNCLIDGRPLYERVAALLREWAPKGDLGAVVGATRPEELESVRQMLPDHWFLLPGVGAQGGTMSQAARSVDAKGSGILVNVSRSIGHAWRTRGRETAPADWRDEVRAAAMAYRRDLEEAIEARS
ncbi:MAG TPA: orotidine-5'-phosphate decarboxylase [Planctomycetes bacterium]|nr:orotidine-5'-phosphate decarboxylase [Planctomycetota bacterium]